MPKIERKDTEKAANKFDKLCKRHRKLFRRKNTQYGNTIVTTGVLGATIELIGAVMRLPSLVLKDRGVSDQFLQELKEMRIVWNTADTRMLVLLDDIISRYENGECHGAHNVEALKDIFGDIHNYANIAEMMLEDKNWDGIL
jgi:hypothetical protein